MTNEAKDAKDAKDAKESTGVKRSTVGKGSAVDMVIVDLGTKRSSQIQRLRRGEGKLVDDIRDTVDELKRNAIISEASETPVVIVVDLLTPWRAW